MVGFQTMVIMDLWGMAYHPVVVIALIYILLFNSISTCCGKWPIGLSPSFGPLRDISQCRLCYIPRDRPSVKIYRQIEIVGLAQLARYMAGLVNVSNAMWQWSSLLPLPLSNVIVTNVISTYLRDSPHWFHATQGYTIWDKIRFVVLTENFGSESINHGG